MSTSRYIPPDRIRAAGTYDERDILKCASFVLNELTAVADDELNDSVYVGNAGLALTFMIAGDVFTRRNLTAGKFDSATCYAEALRRINLCHLSKSRCTFLEGCTGVLAIKIALAHRMGHLSKLADLRNQLLESVRGACDTLKSDECEVLYGRAGVLYSVLYVQPYLGRNDSELHQLQVRLVKEIVTAGVSKARDRSDSLPMTWEWHQKEYLGAAHGHVGIIHMLILASDSFPEAESAMGLDKGTIVSLIEDTFIFLLENGRFPSGNLMPSLGPAGSDKLVAFCHGAPGLLLTIMEIMKRPETFPTIQPLAKAAMLELTPIVMERGCLKKVGMCHGLSGNGVVLLGVAKATRSVEYTNRAYQYAIFGFDNREKLANLADRPVSLFEGVAGLAYLLCALLAPDVVTFPGY